MSKDRYDARILIGLSFLVSACSTAQPSHYGKFDFEGTVRTQEGKPVAGAWVKVRNWETLSDADGHWHQSQILHCGALRDQPGSYEEPDAVLVMADGYVSSEEKFVVKHPGWFVSCKPEQKVVLDTVLQAKNAAGVQPSVTEVVSPKAHRESYKKKNQPAQQEIPEEEPKGTYL